MPDDDTEHAADQPDRSTFGQQPGKQAAARQAERTQEGEFGAPPDHGQGLRRKDQEAASQQRDGGQHGQIDPVGA